MCYLSTLARFFFLNTNNLLKNADFLVYGKSAEFSRVGDFHTFYQIGLENKKFSEKFCNFQKEFSFSDKFSEIFINFKRNA